MALTKKMLKAMNIEDAQIEQIFDAHEESINALRDARNTLQAELDKANDEVKRLSSVEKDLVKANAKVDEAEELQEKYNDLKKEYSEYKSNVEADKVHTAKEKAYRGLLIDAGVSEKRVDSILRITNLEDVELTDDNKIKDADKLSENIKSEWSDFIVTEGKQGADTPKPPENNGGDTFEKMSLADKMAFANENPDNDEVKAWLK